MITVTKFLTTFDLEKIICGCSNNEKFKILYREVIESELRINSSEEIKGAHILRNEKIVVTCENCKKIYFIMTTFEGGFKEQYISVDSVELFDGSNKELRSILNNMYDEYESEIINMATDDYSVKVLENYKDEEKVINKYVYLNREDKDLYKDLME